LNGYEPSDFAVRILEKWGVGQKGMDKWNFYPRKTEGQSDEDGKIAISTGYGVEHLVNRRAGQTDY
jgi:uncharacterized protein